MVLIGVEAVPAGRKPSAAGESMRTFMGERCGFGASAHRALPMHFSGVGDSTITPKLVEPSSTPTEELSPFFPRSAAASSVRLQILVSSFYICLRGETWLLNSMLQSCKTLGCRSHLLGKFAQCLSCQWKWIDILSKFLSILSKLFFTIRYRSAIVGSPDLYSS